ncbi:MAG: inositol 2-dehydrogenase [Cutibacterium avidum]|nr:inositol 2-dehydrogenase [Cutibacterium avidum]
MLKIAVIGAGRIGHVHARSVAAHPDAELVLASDPFGDAAENLAKEYGARFTKDADEVFADPDVDAVIIGSPTDLHLGQLIAAAKAGKAVLCEKPIALEVAKVDQVQAELDKINTPVMFGFNRRFDPSFAAAVDAAKSGKIGTVEQVTIISRDPAAPPAQYLTGSGGIFCDMTIHDFDMARHILGDVVEVSAFGQNFNADIKAIGDFDAAVIVLRSSTGAIATITNDRACAPGYDQRLEIHGTSGSVSIDNVRPTTLRLNNSEVTAAQQPYLDFFLERYADAYSRELSAFIKAVSTGEKPNPGIDDAVAALRLADAATVSAHEGQAVSLV